MSKKIKLFCCLCFIVSFVFCNNVHQPTTKQMNQLLNNLAKVVWQEAMQAKNQVNNILPLIREDYIENLSASAPRVDFIAHADIADTLTELGLEANVYISTNNQSSWFNNSDVYPLNSPGYETTWEAITQTDGSDNIYWYLAGLVNSVALGLDFGNMLVSQSPYNNNNNFPPGDNLYALLATDDTGDAGSEQDITNIRASYSDNKLFASLGLSGSCCNEGGFFGPWNLYVVAIVNPDSETQTAYALGYGSGGFGQLVPGVYKIDGDLATGEVGGFELLTEAFDYNTGGANFQAGVSLDVLINDSNWGPWPNSLSGVIVVGTTVAASLDGLDIAVELLDSTDPGLLVMSTQQQSGNVAPALFEPSFDSSSGDLSVWYSDVEGNLAVSHAVILDNVAYNMTPESHTYLDGAMFSLNLDNIAHNNSALFDFGDGSASVVLDFSFDGGSSCLLEGDANEDGVVNVLDVVLTVNIILCADCPDNYNACSDLNGDMVINVLDVVSIVNNILGLN